MSKFQIKRRPNSRDFYVEGPSDRPNVTIRSRDIYSAPLARSWAKAANEGRFHETELEARWVAETDEIA